ncbi:MAG: urate hydroxylase PuuD [Ferruginibacter sp.]
MDIGFCLLFVVYYFNAAAMLIDKNVLDISPLAGIGIGLGSFVVGWILYDVLCKSPLRKKNLLFTVTGVLLATAIAYGYSLLFNSRAAYIHIGALLGSIMVANVFFVIIPAQKAMVKAAREGKPLDPQLGKNAGLRSLHNNYFTLPVLFVMISNHFPSTFGNENSWLILAIITLGTAGVKHYLNLREKGQLSVWVMPVSVLVLIAAVMISAPEKPGACNTTVGFTEVNLIIQSRCVSCHSSKPTDEFYTAPPNGISYETPGEMVKLKDKIMQRVVVTKTMPQNNKTNMTQKERDIIRCWIEQGASLK